MTLSKESEKELREMDDKVLQGRMEALAEAVDEIGMMMTAGDTTEYKKSILSEVREVLLESFCHHVSEHERRAKEAKN